MVEKQAYGSSATLNGFLFVIFYCEKTKKRCLGFWEFFVFFVKWNEVVWMTWINAILYQGHNFNRRALFSISIQSTYFIHLSFKRHPTWCSILHFQHWNNSCKGKKEGGIFLSKTFSHFSVSKPFIYFEYFHAGLKTHLKEYSMLQYCIIYNSLPYDTKKRSPLGAWS